MADIIGFENKEEKVHRLTNTLDGSLALQIYVNDARGDTVVYVNGSEACRAEASDGGKPFYCGSISIPRGEFTLSVESQSEIEKILLAENLHIESSEDFEVCFMNRKREWVFERDRVEYTPEMLETLHRHGFLFDQPDDTAAGTAPSGVPLGGMGCGKLEICFDGMFTAFTGNNNQDCPIYRMPGSFLALACGDKVRIIRKDPLGLPYQPMEKVEADLEFPFAKLVCTDVELPVLAEVNAFSAHIPGNAPDSALPCVFFEVKLQNQTSKEAEASFCFSWDGCRIRQMFHHKKKEDVIMRKKIWSILLAAAMTVSLLVGCGGNNSGNEKTDGNTEQSSDKTQNEEQNSGELETVKILCQYWPGDYSAQVIWEDGGYAAVNKLNEDLAELGVKLEVEFVAQADFAGVVSTRMATGTDIPDFISYIWIGNNEADVLEWAQNGLVWSVDELCEQYDEDGSIRKFYEEYAPGMWEYNTAEDGNMYWFTYLGVDDAVKTDYTTGQEYNNYSGYVLSVRKDWMDKIGQEVPEYYTLENLKDYLVACREKDANGNGAQDEIANLNWSTFETGIATAFGLTNNLICGYNYTDNKVYSNFYHENFPAYIEYMRELYQAGVITSDSFASDNQVASQNRSALEFNDWCWDYEGSLTDIEGVQYYPVLLDVDDDLSNGTYIRGSATMPSCYGQYFVPKQAENVEGIMKVMNYVFSEEYVILAQMGVEGKGYTIDADGRYVKELYGTTVEATDEKKEKNGLDTVGMLVLPNEKVSCFERALEPRYSDDAPTSMKEKKDAYYEWMLSGVADKCTYISDGVSNTAMPFDSEIEVINEYKATLETYCQELLTDLILGNKSLDNLEEYQKELESLGLKEYMEVCQARRDRMLVN